MHKSRDESLEIELDKQVRKMLLMNLEWLRNSKSRRNAVAYKQVSSVLKIMDLKDKTINDKLIFTHSEDTQNYPFYRIQLVV